VLQAAVVRTGKWVSAISAQWHWAPKEFSTSWADVQPLNCNMRNRDCVPHLSKNKAYWGHSELLLKG